jgi:hypothetical protein
MIPFSNQGAKHFCGKFSSSSPADTAMRDFFNVALSKKKSFKEGEQVFSEYRDSLLREADRCFFLGVTCFRRSLDLFSSASVFWAHVSLYYSSWFAAHSVLGMFGCWVQGDGKVVQVKNHSPGLQEFAVTKDYSTQHHGGSHQFFWDAYYNAMKAVVLWTDPSLQLAVKPISSNHIWAIEKRNLINYQTIQAFKLMDGFSTGFDPDKFPASLQGDVATQFQLARTLLLFCADRASEFALKTDVFPATGTRAQAIKELIFKTTPSKLSHHSEESKLSV